MSDLLNDPLRKTHLQIILVWISLLMGQVVLLVVVAMQVSAHAAAHTDPSTARLLFYIGIIMLVFLVPLGYFVRSQVYKANWRENAVTPRGYITGNIILLAMCEGVSMFGLVVCMLAGSFWPALLISAAAMGVQAVNFPNGRAMQPDVPVFARKPNG